VKGLLRLPRSAKTGDDTGNERGRQGRNVNYSQLVLFYLRVNRLFRGVYVEGVRTSRGEVRWWLSLAFKSCNALIQWA
jgi:hypothetical protein